MSMSISIRRTLVVAAGIAMLGVTATASAGVNGKMLEKLRDRQADKEQSAAQPAQPAQRSAPRNQPPPAAQRSPESRPNHRRGQQPDTTPVSPPAAQPRGNGDRGVVGELLSRNLRRGDSAGGRGNDHDGDHSAGGHSRPPRVVPSLPRGYRNYSWNDRPYYTFGGSWYRPYGSSYIAIGAPYGLFVSSLPGYSASFYYGNTRYYYYDDTYYTYEPERRGYVVARSPYGDDEDKGDYDQALDEGHVHLSIACPERPAAGGRSLRVPPLGSLPIALRSVDDEYDRTRRDGYVRAMTACLTGRGYSVR